MPSSSCGQRKVCMSAVRALRERLGDSGMAGLEEVINNAGKQWKDDVLAVAAERFDKRLAEEIGALRVDLAKEFGSVRVEMAKEFAAVRSEIGVLRFDLVKWCFVFWIGQVATMTAIVGFLLRTFR